MYEYIDICVYGIYSKMKEKSQHIKVDPLIRNPIAHLKDRKMCGRWIAHIFEITRFLPKNKILNTPGKNVQVMKKDHLQLALNIPFPPDFFQLRHSLIPRRKKKGRHASRHCRGWNPRRSCPKIKAHSEGPSGDEFYFGFCWQDGPADPRL